MKKLVKWLMFLAGSGVTVVLLLVAFIWFSGQSGQASHALATPELIIQPDDTRTLLAIDTTQSEARFIIDELLLGEPTTVVGRTNEIAGEILIDFDNPMNSQLGAILVNVATLQTDNELRNRALRGQILQANNPEFEVATFIPTQLLGLPESIAMGDTIQFQIEGTLNLHGVNRTLIFDANITVISETQITGTVSTVVQYSIFNITIPEVAGVADVSDDVQLVLDFVASPADSNN